MNERDATGWQPKLDEQTLWSVLPIDRPVRVPGGYPAHLFTPTANLEEIVKYQCAAIPKIMRAHGGRMPTMAYLFCQNDPIDGHPEPCLYSMQLRDDERAYVAQGKDFFAVMLRMTATLGNALGVAFLAEIWSLKRDTPPEEVERVFHSAESISNHPNREEMVFVNLHVRGSDLTYAARAPFIRYNPRSIVIGEWQHLPGSTNEGRFKDIMKPLDPDFFDKLSEQRSQVHGL